MIQGFLYQKNKLSKFDVSKLKNANELKRKKAKIWVAVKNPTSNDINLLKEKFNLHPITIEDIASIKTRIKYEEFDENTVIVLKGIKKIKESKVTLYTFFNIDGDGYAITVFHTHNDTIENLINNPTKIEMLLKKGEDYVVHYIIDKEVDKYVDIRERLFEELQDIEERFMKKLSKDILHQLFLKESVILKISQRAYSITDVCARLMKPTENYISNDLIPYFRDVYDHALRVSEALKTYLDRINGIRSSYLSLASNRMNETMRLLTIIMALMMPMSIITGFFGMNIALPIQKHPQAYLIVIIVMFAISILMLYIFKMFKWTKNSY